MIKDQRPLVVMTSRHTETQARWRGSASQAFSDVECLHFLCASLCISTGACIVRCTGRAVHWSIVGRCTSQVSVRTACADACADAGSACRRRRTRRRALHTRPAYGDTSQAQAQPVLMHVLMRALRAGGGARGGGRCIRGRHAAAPVRPGGGAAAPAGRAERRADRVAVLAQPAARGGGRGRGGAPGPHPRRAGCHSWFHGFQHAKLMHASVLPCMQS